MLSMPSPHHWTQGEMVSLPRGLEASDSALFIRPLFSPQQGTPLFLFLCTQMGLLCGSPEPVPHPFLALASSFRAAALTSPFRPVLFSFKFTYSCLRKPLFPSRSSREVHNFKNYVFLTFGACALNCFFLIAAPS